MASGSITNNRKGQAVGLAEDWLKARDESKAMHKAYKELEAKLLAELGDQPREITFEGRAFSLTPVNPSRTVWDKQRVMELFTPAQRKRLTTAELDVDAFTAAIKSKELDYKTFAPFKSVKAGDGYVRATAK